MSRRYPERPVLGVGAIILDGERILLVERGREPLAGYWSLPGGAVETGERLESAVCREVLEETGLVVRPERVLEIFERIMQDAEGRTEYHYVLIDYICRPEGGEARPGDDASRVAWWPEESLEQLRLTEGTLAVIQKAFREERESHGAV